MGDREELILLSQFCLYHQVETSFIYSLRDNDLISIEVVQGEAYIPMDQIRKLEKLVRLHYDLSINLEGIEVIQHLLDRMDTMEGELRTLRNKLRLFDE